MTADDETRVMSRALTRGATMLDDACDDCGNPLFRYQGEVFCPVCQELHGDETGAADDADEDGDEDRDGGDADAEGAGTYGAADGMDEVDEHLHALARRLARDAAESADDVEAVERRLEALERTVELLRRTPSS